MLVQSLSHWTGGGVTDLASELFVERRVSRRDMDFARPVKGVFRDMDSDAWCLSLARREHLCQAAKLTLLLVKPSNRDRVFCQVYYRALDSPFRKARIGLFTPHLRRPSPAGAKALSQVGQTASTNWVEPSQTSGPAGAKLSLV